jgi:hypothetical protein
LSPRVAFPPLAVSNFFAINDDVLGSYDTKVNFIALDGEHDHLNGIADTDHFIFLSRYYEHGLAPLRSAMRAGPVTGQDYCPAALAGWGGGEEIVISECEVIEAVIRQWLDSDGLACRFSGPDHDRFVLAIAAKQGAIAHDVLTRHG